MKSVAIYIRTSNDSSDSLQQQQKTLNNYVKSQKDMIVYSTYIDDGISGQKLERDEFQRLMNDVQNDEIDLIIFTTLNRLSRSFKQYSQIQNILETHNVSWLAVSQTNYDTTTI